MQKFMIGIFAFVLILASFGLPTADRANASSTYYAYVKSYTLKVRDKASTKYRTLRTLTMGNKVKVTRNVGAFSKVTYGRTTGYVQAKNLSRTKFRSYTAFVKSYTLKMRSNASTHYSVKKTLAMGNQVTVIGKGNKYALVSFGSLKGYVQNAYLLTTPFPSYTVYVTSPTLKLRDHASTHYHVLRTMQFRDQVTVTGKGVKYAQVNANGIIGYVQAKYLGTTPPPTLGYMTTQYPYSLSDAVNKQLKTLRLTDATYSLFVPKNNLTYNGIQWEANTATNVWGGPDNQSWVVTQIAKGKVVQLVRSLDNSDWDQVGFKTGWVNASPADVQYNLDPNNFQNGSAESYQFLDLSVPTAVNPDEVNNKLLKGRGILAGKAATFIQAANQQHINEIYLIVHALLETGNGSSPLATGYSVSSVNGQPVDQKVVYNMYGIGAVDSDPNEKGAEFAYQQGWFTPEAAIIGGAQFIASNYINSSVYHQNTLYKMRWNPANTGAAAHQYATDIGWAVKQARMLKDYYNLLSTYSLKFDIPKYR
ncbi:SH3 domain-containing protein [Sporolactobacillus kofuensis]|uniref:SH3 domain-containing protein n=1 Tax=Sporolactobacillus kofuensis TaxID=269672 RepID=A0ABW1WEX2_9BACL|nr:SH3 domain-containing protein [Sporolactobacillus kofuensis]MCO7174903.1 SH3 domain-containing protein [Sporolactobacillus kofuensis]